MFDINSVDDLIGAFGGASKLGSSLGIGDTAVHNWSARGFIPPSWHMRLYVDLRKMGKTATPELFELDGENACVLYPEASVAA
jgi:hypothetical protein